MRIASSSAASLVVMFILALSVSVGHVEAAPLLISLDSDTLLYSAGEDAVASLSGNPLAKVIVTVLNSTGGLVSNVTVTLNSSGKLALGLNATVLQTGAYTVNATMGASHAQVNFSIVPAFIGLEVRAAGADGAELSRATPIYYYFNGSSFNVLANVSAPNSHFVLASNMSAIGVGEFSFIGSEARSTGPLSGGGAWYLFLLNGTVPGNSTEIGQARLSINASAGTGAAASENFTAVMNIQPLTVDPALGGATMDWRSVPDLTNASGVVIERHYGGEPQVRVAFMQPIDLCMPDVPGTIQSLVSFLKTGLGRVYLNVSGIPAFNSSAQITMFGLEGFGLPGIIVDGVPTVRVGEEYGGQVSGLVWESASSQLSFAVSSWGEFVADSQAPYAVSMSMNNGQFTGDSTPTVSFVMNDTLCGVDPERVAFAFDSNATDVIFDVSGNWSAGWIISSTAAALPDGLHSAGLRVSDNLGNVAVIYVSFYVDTAPPVFSGTFPASGLITRETMLPAGVGYSDSLSGAAKAWLFLDGINYTSYSTASPGHISFIPLSALLEGAHQLRVIAFDAVGNNKTLEWGYTVDLTAPTMSYHHPDTNMIVPLNDSIYADYTDNYGVNKNLTRVFVDGVEVTAQSSIGEGHLLYTPSPMLSKGTHQAIVTLFDTAGNSATTSWSFIVDNIPPSIVISSPANGTKLETQSVSVSVMYYDNLNVVKSSVLIKMDGKDVTGQASVYESSLVYQATLEWGNHTVEVWATDTSGNTGKATAVFSMSPSTIPAGLIQDILIIAIVMLVIVAALVAVFILGNKKKRADI